MECARTVWGTGATLSSGRGTPFKLAARHGAHNVGKSDLQAHFSSELSIEQVSRNSRSNPSSATWLAVRPWACPYMSQSLFLPLGTEVKLFRYRGAVVKYWRTNLSPLAWQITPSWLVTLIQGPVLKKSPANPSHLIVVAAVLKTAGAKPHCFMLFQNS